MLEDNEFICADCGTVFEANEYTFGGYLCSECSMIKPKSWHSIVKDIIKRSLTSIK